MLNCDRAVSYRRSNDLEDVLFHINSFLEKTFLNEFQSERDENEFPMIFIFGCARSGTTLFFQWLASKGIFAYPTNVISRFFGAPAFGALVHKALCEYDMNQEIFPNEAKNFVFHSDLGKCKGASSPHEFWYFWKRFFPFGEIQKLSEEDLKNVDINRIKQELIGLEQVFRKPLVMKAMILNWHVPFLYRIFPKALYVHIHREPFFNGQSLIKAREKFFNDVTKWYSFKPPEYYSLNNLSPIEQVAGQVYFTNKAISEGMEKLPEKNTLSVSYDVFCKDPAEIQDKFSRKYISIEGTNRMQTDMKIENENFESNTQIRIGKKDFERFWEYYNFLSSN